MEKKNIFVKFPRNQWCFSNLLIKFFLTVFNRISQKYQYLSTKNKFANICTNCEYFWLAIFAFKTHPLVSQQAFVIDSVWLYFIIKVVCKFSNNVLILSRSPRFYEITLQIFVRSVNIFWNKLQFMVFFICMRYGKQLRLWINIFMIIWLNHTWWCFKEKYKSTFFNFFVCYSFVFI